MKTKRNAILPTVPKSDSRLLGTWKSDKVRTMTEWIWKKNITARQKATIQSLFGKLEITYTRNKIISKLKYREYESKRNYLLLGVDESSAAIITFGELHIPNRRKYWPTGIELLKEFCSHPQIQHIHFEKKHFWISLSNGRNREFFRKISRVK